MSYENADLRNLAQNRPCHLLAPGVVDHPEGTSVWAHSNLQEHGKGKGIKAHDCFGALACRNCHAWLDESHASAEEKRDAFIAGMHRTMLYLWTSGLIGVVRHGAAQPRAHSTPTVSKVLPRNLPRTGRGVSARG
ncbi:nuclease domain-containing protein [Nevskia ramosa]|uniref:nuclease domain-containing protein n=1 Tax=Nevskia ramosa TaxID=64002 RepID=UPI003D144196